METTTQENTMNQLTDMVLAAQADFCCAHAVLEAAINAYDISTSRSMLSTTTDKLTDTIETAYQTFRWAFQFAHRHGLNKELADTMFYEGMVKDETGKEILNAYIFKLEHTLTSEDGDTGKCMIIPVNGNIMLKKLSFICDIIHGEPILHQSEC